MAQTNPDRDSNLDLAVETLLKVDDERLGQLVRDYLTASHFDTTWEGFDQEELNGVEALLSDMVRYLESVGH